MKNYKVWLSYDLGNRSAEKQLSKPIDGEKYQERYRALKSWLDEKNAEECGESIAYFQYKGEEGIKVQNALKQDLLKVFSDANITDLEGMPMYAIIAGEIELKEPLYALFYSDFIVK